jgi:dienelactone hydrolase
VKSFAILALASVVSAAEPTQDYLIRAADAIRDRAGAEIASAESWEKVRAKRAEEMRDMLGLLPWPERTPLRVRVTGTLDKGSYTVEKLAFESLPKVYVTANLYVPKQRAGRVPAIVYVCGHSYSPYGAKERYQRHGISLAKNGYVAIILDPIQIAETWGAHHGVHSQEMYDWYARGYTPAGVEVWNAMRAIDYLEGRPEVDKNRIGMTGRSGGAAMTWFTAAVDARVKVAVPVMGISTYAANLRENTQRLHCDCMFAINSHRHDMLHQGALIAPRPLLMAHGRKDALFPVPGYKDFEDRVGALYASYGKRGDFGNVEVDTGHEDSDFLRERAIRFFDEHLMGIPARKLDMDYSNAPGEELAVFGGNPPADAVTWRIHETFIPTPARPASLAELREKVLATVPRKFKVDVTAAGRAASFQELRIAHDGVPLRALLWKPSRSEKPVPAVLYVASDGEEAGSIQEFMRGVMSRGAGAILAVFPRGTGEWNRTEWKAMLRNSMHVGETVDSMRLGDVLAAAEALRGVEDVDATRIMTLGKGIAGTLGMYAALLDERIKQVMLVDPPSSHVEGPIFLNVLRHIDLPQAAALLAPRQLSFYARMPRAYEKLPKGGVFLSMSIEGPLTGRYNHAFTSGN